MKSSFTTSWNKSTQARKQRKYRYKAPLHIKGKFLRAKLEKSLSEKHKKKSARIRQGDEVVIQRGQFKGVSGVVERVDTKNNKVFVRGAEHVKDDSTKRPYPIAASNVMIVKIVEDKKRFKKNG